jgi:hypothetical protein
MAKLIVLIISIMLVLTQTRRHWICSNTPFSCPMNKTCCTSENKNGYNCFDIPFAMCCKNVSGAYTFACPVDKFCNPVTETCDSTRPAYTIPEWKDSELTPVIPHFSHSPDDFRLLFTGFAQSVKIYKNLQPPQVCEFDTPVFKPIFEDIDDMYDLAYSSTSLIDLMKKIPQIWAKYGDIKSYVHGITGLCHDYVGELLKRTDDAVWFSFSPLQEMKISARVLGRYKEFREMFNTVNDLCGEGKFIECGIKLGEMTNEFALWNYDN